MFSWFALIVGTDKDGKEIRHPAYQGTERLSNDGTMFLMHDEIAVQRGCKTSKTVSLSGVALASKLSAVNPMNCTDAIMTKDEAQTKTLMESTAWLKADATLEKVIDVGGVIATK